MREPGSAAAEGAPAAWEIVGGGGAGLLQQNAAMHVLGEHCIIPLPSPMSPCRPAPAPPPC